MKKRMKTEELLDRIAELRLYEEIVMARDERIARRGCGVKLEVFGLSRSHGGIVLVNGTDAYLLDRYRTALESLSGSGTVTPALLWCIDVVSEWQAARRASRLPVASG